MDDFDEPMGDDVHAADYGQADRDEMLAEGLTVPAEG